MWRRRRMIVAGGFALVAMACSSDYLDGASGVDAGAPVDASGDLDVSADGNPVDAGDGVDATAAPDADAARPASFCTGKKFVLCEDFEDVLLPPSWTTSSPPHGTFTESAGANSPRALSFGPGVEEVDAGDAGPPPTGATLVRELTFASAPSFIDVSFQFRIATVRFGGELVNVDIGNGHGFSLSVSEGTIGFQLAVTVTGQAGPKQAASYLVGNTWIEVHLTVTATGSHDLTIDGVHRSTDAIVKFSPVPAGASMKLRFGSYTSTTYPPPSMLPTIQLDDVLVNAL